MQAQQSCLRVFSVRLAATMIAAGVALPVAVLAAERAFLRTADSAEFAWGPCPAFMPEGCALAVLHGDPAARNADVFFRLPAKTTAPRHWHASAERMILVSGEMQVTYQGQDPFVLTPGSYAYGPARVAHDATCSSDQDCLLFIAFEEPVDVFAGTP